jgi:GT2 family glycosyltransferase
MKLTIGMSTYDDFDGVYFSVQALRIYQDLPKDTEIIVIDNNPDGKHGEANKKFIEDWAHGTYIPFRDRQSTFTKYEVFKHAKGEYVLCMDSHVLLEKNSITSLLSYYNKNPDTKNLVTGPLWYDDLKNYSTQFDPIWRDSMYGIWGTNKEAYEKGEPFEIPMMGLGCFSAKRSNWIEVNNQFKGFGGEEGYIHEKIRRNGGKCICLPSFKWLHRFSRPLGVPYTNTLNDRARNYLIGWIELFGNKNHPAVKSIIKEFENKVNVQSILDSI